jgi:hypothetical protein
MLKPCFNATEKREEIIAEKHCTAAIFSFFLKLLEAQGKGDAASKKWLY